ncbi:tetratricopeptide repeat protein [Desulfococcaceae bacterium HSG9]|nr:tetratricopeptide repeat protein [Desulfococcaceae bacterium HSG9]
MQTYCKWGLNALILIFLFVTVSIAAETEKSDIKPNGSNIEMEPVKVYKSMLDDDKLLEKMQLDSALNSSERLLNLEAGGAATSSGFTGLSLRTQKTYTLIAEYQATLVQDPQNLTALTKLAGAWESLGQWDKAIAIYKKIKTLKKDSKAVEQKIERLKSMSAYRVRLNFSYIADDQYLPALKRSVYKWNEASAQIQIAKHWGPHKMASVGFLRSHIDQENELYGDTDFSLLRQAPFIHLAWPFSDFIKTQMRLRYEIFEDREDDGFYQLGATKNLWTGYLLINYANDNIWANLSYSRERDPDPLYEAETDRAQLNIETQELSGLEVGWGLAPSWEIAGSVFYESYGTLRSDQFNLNIQQTYRPSWLPALETALGAGYYTEEDETLVNWTAGYKWNFMKRMGLKLEYQLEYSANEDSWLNQGELLLTWRISPRLSFALRSHFGQEVNGDRDTYFLVDSGLEYRFY